MDWSLISTLLALLVIVTVFVRYIKIREKIDAEYRAQRRAEDLEWQALILKVVKENTAAYLHLRQLLDTRTCLMCNTDAKRGASETVK